MRQSRENGASYVGQTDANLYAEGKSMVELRHYLCSAASKPGRPVETDVCRKCEVGCGFGKQWVRRIDAGENPRSRKRG